MAKLGAHLSSAGGVSRAVAAAVRTGCESLQLFLRPPGRWATPPLAALEVERFRAASTVAGLDGFSFAHAPYLLNPASADDQLRRRSIDTLIEELERAGRLGLAGVVLHPGSARDGDRSEAASRCRDAIVEAVERAGANAARLLLEGDVGAGGQLGASPAELHELVDGTIVGRVGVCLDTAHLWGAGFDLVDDGWERVLSELAERWQRPAPDLLHGNDSAVECGSHRDRHASPGAGALGERFYRQLLADPRLAATPIIIEIPSGENDEDITAALARLHSWCRETGEREGGRGESGKRKARHARPRTND